jgi:hypothetical protein
MIIETDLTEWMIIENTINAAFLRNGDSLKIRLIPANTLPGLQNGNYNIEFTVIQPPPLPIALSPTNIWNGPGLSPPSQPQAFFPWFVNPVSTPDTSIPEPKPEPKKEIDYSKITKSLSGK